MRLPRLLPMVLALGVLAACDPARVADPQVRPVSRPDPPATQPAPSASEPSAESRSLEAYYGRVEGDLLTQGLLRRDGGGPDTPFDADRLARTFLRVALFEEYTTEAGTLVARETESRLHRWDQPVRIETRFGASVPASVRRRDEEAIGRFADRLGRAANHPITAVPTGGNFTVFVVNEDERRALGPDLRRIVPGISRTALSSVLDLPRSSYCVVFALDPSNSGRYTRAVAIIRSEHPDLLRLSCIHEEIAQGLGLSNDTPLARPSVFNDDEEFALLTTHDELLLKMLYDRRLRPGMSAADAAPIAAKIARELLDAPS